MTTTCNKKLSAKDHAFNLLREYNTGDTFLAYDLRDRVFLLSDEYLSDGTITRYIREYRELYGVDIRPVLGGKKMMYRVEG